MNSKFWVKSLFQLPFLLALIALPLLAVVKDPAWEKYITSQTENQEVVYRLIDATLQDDEDLSKLLNINREVQSATIEQKSLRYYHLFSHHPERIVRSFGFKSFIQFPWTNEDEKSLRKESKDYRKLSKKLKKMKSELEEDLHYTTLSEKFILLSNTSEYQSAEKRFSQLPFEVEKILHQQVQNISYHEYRGGAQ